MCRFKTSPCVGSKRLGVYRQNARMLNTCARFAGTHGGVLNLHTGGFPRAKPRYTQTPQHTTHHPTHTLSTYTTHSQHTRTTISTHTHNTRHVHIHIHIHIHTPTLTQHISDTTHTNAWTRAQPTTVILRRKSECSDMRTIDNRP